MKNLTNRDFLLQRQYYDATNLQARIELHQRFGTNPEGIPRWFVAQLQLPESVRLLEVGCGPGGYWPEVADLIPRSWHITVSDFSPGMVAEAQRRLAALDRPVSVVLADVQYLPFADQSFDAVIANFMLYHVADRPRALAEIHRVLSPYGQVFAMTNGERHMQELRELVNHVAPGMVRTEGAGFGLEDGAEQLAPWFEHIRLVRYPDRLVVTEIEPIVAYVRSYISGLSSDQEQALREKIQTELDRQGALAITKDSGLFTGVKRR